ncbi:gp58-like family protein [Flavobacterium agricola]|uniref:Gp58-like family protein n=1 Tax=Flavobacterium agricola TaxID=2870839 RepID=A0ABY6M3P2_9FLAO|nr:gp58-like family protein [Flavobacterium agricola]UYW02125.1 gp58-like family protein [Flavobacterium agricola]
MSGLNSNDRELLRRLTERLNLIESNAKRIDELPYKSKIGNSDKLHISENGISKYITVQELLSAIETRKYDHILYINGLRISGNELQIDGAGWTILELVYNLTEPFIKNVPYAAQGFVRTDIVIANTENNLEVIFGDENEGISFAPPIPPNTVLVTTLDVTDNSINNTPAPIGGDDYKSKIENRSVVVSTPNTINSLLLDTEASHIIITAASKVESLNISQNNNAYPGKIYKITNEQSKYLTLVNSSTAVEIGNTKFKFVSNRDYYLLPGETVEFYLSENLNTLVFLGTNRPIENSITINANTTLTNAHHGATLYVLANVNLTFSAPSVLVPDFEVAIKTHTAGVANIITTGWVVSAPDGKKLDVNTMGFIGRIPNTDTLSFGGAFSQ